jgi:cellobiose phosphorylase
MYRVGLESIVGLRPRGSSFSLSPCLPASWDRVRVRWRQGSGLYEFTVENPGRRSRGVAEATLDGVAVDPAAIPLLGDGAVHQVRVVIGDPAPGAGLPAAASAPSLGSMLGS